MGLDENRIEGEPKSPKNSKTQTKKEKKSICPICKRDFRKPSLLQRHQSVHSNEKLFECPHCNKKFAQKASQTRHVQHVHEGVKKYQCSKCERSFSQRLNLEAHVKSTHPIKQQKEKVSYACSKCPCVFGKLNVLNRHLAAQHTNDEVPTENPKALADHVTEQLKMLQNSIQGSTVKDDKPLEAEDDIPKLLENEKRDISPIVKTLNPNVPSSSRLEKNIIIQSVETFYQCHDCKKCFESSILLQRHRRRTHCDKPFKCDHCIKTFTTKGKLLDHSKRHTLDEKTGILKNQHKCEFCQLNFNSMRRLDLHTQLHRATGCLLSYICSTCNKQFKTRAAFARHTHDSKDAELEKLQELLCDPIDMSKNDVSSGEKQAVFECRLCNLRLKNEISWKKHEARHANASRYKCSDCSRHFLSYASLYLHRKRHNLEEAKPFTCPMCPSARFLLRAQLKQHTLLVHEDSRNFACPYCEQRFKTKGNCKSHIKTHIKQLLETKTSKEKRASSLRQGMLEEDAPCNESYGGKPTKDQASASLPTNSPKFIELEKMHNCRKHRHRNFQIEKLNKSLTELTATPSDDGAAESSASTGENKKTCSYCSKTFKKPSDLQRHLLIHLPSRPFACQTCDKSFKLQSTLTDHLQTHLSDAERRKSSCQVCGKSYASKKSLVVHQRLHTLESPFHCDKCGKKFRTSGHLIAHKKAAASSELRGGACSNTKKTLINLTI